MENLDTTNVLLGIMAAVSVLEALLLTALLARRFRAQLVDGHRPLIDMAGTLTIRNGLPVRLTRR